MMETKDGKSRAINVAEQFYSIQGEGPYAGVPAVFLRLAGCNLVCGGRKNLQRDADEMQPEDGATWVCDTIPEWREAENSYDGDDLVAEWKENGWAEAIRRDAHIVLTGGEPLMEQNQRGFLNLIGSLLCEGISPFVEVETNGTIEPGQEFATYIDQFNVSLKLSNSGMPEGQRLNEDAINFFVWTHRDNPDKNATFKFVVSRPIDVEEIAAIAEEYEIPDSMISLMPAGQTQEQLRETYPIVAEICKDRNWRFSPRLQVDIWDEVVGV